MKETEMQHGDLLKLLAQTAEEVEAEDAARLDERWERLLAGTLDDEEAAALVEEAQASEGAARDSATFQPLGRDFHDSVVEALQAQPGGGAAVAAGTARVLPFRRRIWQSGGLAAAVAAVAALLVLLIGRPPHELPPLPEYQVELVGGTRDVRSGEGPAPGAERRFVDGNRLEVLLRPRGEVAGQVAVHCFLARGEELRRCEVPAEISERGSVRLVGEIGRELDVDPGPWTLWLAVGRPGTLPSVEELRAHLGATSAVTWSLYRTSFDVGELDR